MGHINLESMLARAVQQTTHFKVHANTCDQLDAAGLIGCKETKKEKVSDDGKSLKVSKRQTIVEARLAPPKATNLGKRKFAHATNILSSIIEEADMPDD